MVISVFAHSFHFLQASFTINNLVGNFLCSTAGEKINCIGDKKVQPAIISSATFSWFHIAYLLLLVEQSEIFMYVFRKIGRF
uniref:Uncharacterized protein n=1 Tax=Salmonella sp. TaxID=599 RepID=A0A482EX47_SALSP|nr:hypothetical protein NNIBIDOC_00085 [Salmonella sp.]